MLSLDLFFKLDFQGKIEEEQPEGTLVAYINAQDADHGNNGKVHLRLLDSSRSFNLDGDGKLTTTRKLDREIQSTFKMTIEACDQGADARLVFSTLFRVFFLSLIKVAATGVYSREF